MSALGQNRTSGREVRHATFDDVGLVSSHGASERTETGRKTPMAKLVDVWTFDWDKYSPDDLVQKCDSFQPGPALLAALVKSSRATTCGARARLRRPRSGAIRPQCAEWPRAGVPTLYPVKCPLWANSGHRAASFDQLVRAVTLEPKVVHAWS